MTGWQDQLRAARTRGGAAPWTPPQLASLAGAWVVGLSAADGAVVHGAYGTSVDLTANNADALQSDHLLLPAGRNAATPAGYCNVQNASARSVAAWVYVTLAGRYGNLVSWRDDTLSQYKQLGVETYAANKLGIYSEGPYTEQAGAGTYTLAAWHHIALVRVNTGSTLYVDGAVDATLTTSLIQAVTRLSINAAAQWGSVSLRAQCIYEYAAALSAGDIASLYAADPYRRGNL